MTFAEFYDEADRLGWKTTIRRYPDAYRTMWVIVEHREQGGNTGFGMDPDDWSTGLDQLIKRIRPKVTHA